MPQFTPGEAKTAIAPITAKPSGMACEAELFLGPDELTKVASSGRVPFVSTGARQNVRLPIAMPPEGTYHGYIDVFTNGWLFLAYILKEDIVIAAPAPPPIFTYTNVSAQMVTFSPATAFKTMVFRCRVTNPSGTTLTKTMRLIWRYYSHSNPDNVYTFVIWSFSLTLTPGQSYDFVWDGNRYGQRDPGAYNGPLISRRTTHCMHLEDGVNESTEACVSRS